jgi:hypothetical protein
MQGQHVLCMLCTAASVPMSAPYAAAALRNQICTVWTVCVHPSSYCVLVLVLRTDL